MTWPYAAGALVSTVDDLARWQDSLASGKLVRPSTLSRAFTPVKLSDGHTVPYGYGWFIGKLKGMPTLHHGGDIDGFSAEGLWLPKEGIYVAVLNNAQADGKHEVSRETLARGIALTIAGKPAPVPSHATLSKEKLTTYVAVYPIDDKRSHTVRYENGELSIQGTGMPRAPLVHYKTDGFLIGDTDITVDFSRNKTGAVTALAITDDERVSVHKRAP